MNETEPPQVLLYEKGYGKDAASIAMDSVRYARDAGFDVVLIDTAGRMQDNEPLMRALAKWSSVIWERNHRGNILLLQRTSRWKDTDQARH
jgi:signal recognition particle GTPase